MGTLWGREPAVRLSDPARLLEEVRRREARGAELDLLTFFGNAPQADGTPGTGVFSQWWQGHPFTVEGVEYPTAEHYMMAAKARLFGDSAALDRILADPSPRQAKAGGRRVAGFDEPAWSEARYAIVCTGNAAKFGQHPELRAQLVATGRRVLVEASPHDTVWGVGLAVGDARVARPSRWRGLNLLGFALCDVRRHLVEHGDAGWQEQA